MAGELTSQAGIPSWLAWRRPVAREAARWGLHGEDGTDLALGTAAIPPSREVNGGLYFLSVVCSPLDL
jgi:hypothetical protein